MKYHLKLEKSFVKRMDNLQGLFALTRSDAEDARETIIDAISELSAGKKLDEGYDDHILTRSPWTGFHEFHVLNDLLVIYYKVETKKRIRMVTITNHDELSSGHLPE